MTEIEFSIVIACYNEEQSIREFHRRLSRTLATMDHSYEIIFVNDGSLDATFSELENIFIEDEHISVIIDLFNNCGQEAALTAGLVHGRGKRFVVMDSDLQLAPEDLPLIVAEAVKGSDIVGGYRKERKDSLKRKMFSWTLNLLTPWLIKFPARDIGCSFRIFDADLIKSFKPGPYRVFHLYYIFERAKTYAEVPLTHSPRKHGKSGWTTWNLIGLFADNVIGFLHRPFLQIAIACLILSPWLTAGCIAVLIGIVPMSHKAFLGLLMFLSGVQLLMGTFLIACVGEFALRAHSILMRKPAYICRTIKRKNKR